jgi:hypothetical protein
MAQAYKPLPAAEELWECFEYKPLTGQLVWRSVRRKKVIPGTVAGCTSALGYGSVCFKRVNYQIHRLIWVWVTGEDPGEYQVDHIDGNPSNNIWGNLRLATHPENIRNRVVRKDNKLQVKGVFMRHDGKYRARVRHNNVIYNLGAFDTAQEAGAAYRKAAAQLQGEFFKV